MFRRILILNISSRICLARLQASLNSLKKWKDKADILFLSQTKIGEIFSSHQFETDSCRMFPREKNNFGEEIMFYVNKNIPSRILNAPDYLKCFEIILLEFSFRNKKNKFPWIQLKVLWPD